LHTQTHGSSPPLFWSEEVLFMLCSSVLLLLELLLVDSLVLLEEVLLLDSLVLFEEVELELVLLDDDLLASLAASSFFCLQDASYDLPCFLNEATLMLTPLSLISKATARST
jgi:hypothetical protein